MIDREGRRESAANAYEILRRHRAAPLKCESKPSNGGYGELGAANRCTAKQGKREDNSSCRNATWSRGDLRALLRARTSTGQGPGKECCRRGIGRKIFSAGRASLPAANASIRLRADPTCGFPNPTAPNRLPRSNWSSNWTRKNSCAGTNSPARPKSWPNTI